MLTNKITELTDLLVKKTAHQTDNNTGGDPTTITDSDIFERIFDDAILERFGRKEVMDMYYVWNVFSKGLRAARSKYMGASKMYFERGAEMLAKVTEPGTEVYDFLQMYALPNYAYYLYKVKEYSRANDLLDQLLEVLERYEKDLPILHMGKVQQFHNLSRMSFRKREHDEGMRIVSELLTYMMAYQKPDFEGVWSTEHLERTPALLKFDMIHQVFSEMVYNLLLYYKDNEAEAFEKSFAGLINLAEKPQKDKAMNKFLWSWLDAKQAMNNGNQAAGFEQVIDYVNNVSGDFSVFQLSLLRDAYKVTKEQSPEQLPALTEAIVQYGTDKLFMEPEVVGTAVDTVLTSETVKTFRAPLC